MEMSVEAASDLLLILGPTLGVQIGFDEQYRPGIGRLPALPSSLHPGLVDTGASLSCIDSDLAVLLDLPVVDRKPVAGVHGAQEVNMHLAQIYIPTLQHVVYGEFAGVHLKAGGQQHLALIGRHFLQAFTMTYDGRTGSVIIRKE